MICCKNAINSLSTFYIFLYLVVALLFGNDALAVGLLRAPGKMTRYNKQLVAVNIFWTLKSAWGLLALVSDFEEHLAPRWKLLKNKVQGSNHQVQSNSSNWMQDWLVQPTRLRKTTWILNCYISVIHCKNILWNT